MNLPDVQFFDTFDWFILLLRIAFIALIYLFLYQVGRVCVRELVVLGRVTSMPHSSGAMLPDPVSSLELLDPGESSLIPGAAIPLDHYTTIGRNVDNTIAIDDGFVSGSHAELMFDGGAWWLQDLGSTNGTLCNTQPVRSRVRVSDGDIVQFGRVRFRAHV